MRRNEIADAHELQRRIAKILDDATVALMALTSSPAAVIRAAYEDRAGVPAYDAAPPPQPRDVLTPCGYCGARFWDRSGGLRRYCDDSCRQCARYHRQRGHAVEPVA